MSLADDSRPSERLSGRDWRLILLCILLAAAAIAVVSRYFDSAFPEASIEFRVNRDTSRPIAERFAIAQGNTLAPYKHAARFDGDGHGRIFLERSLGLKQANELARERVHVWYWRHRWFTPLVEEEVSVDVAPTGEIIGYSRTIPEDRRLPPATGNEPPWAFLKGLGVATDDLTLVSSSERRLPGRVQRIDTFESKSVRPAGATYRHTVTTDGSVITGYTQQLKPPEEWLRSYRQLRSKNQAAGSVDLLFNLILTIAAVAVFVIRLRRGDLSLRFLVAIGIATVILVGGVALNSVPAQLAWYDTTTSWPAYVAQVVMVSLLQSIGMAMLLIVVCGAGEVLYRERLPNQLAMPLLWTRKALGSKRVFLSLILGYALVPMFMAYQVIFYLTAQKFGAWSPAEVPYDEMLNSAFPWVAVLFAGFFPAFSEEFLSRAFAIPFLQRFVHSRFFAIVLAAFIWGFGHSTYPNQPFWIRGVEVGLVGIVAGYLMDRFGLLPLLIWHYTIDAVYTATLLLASGNRYYIVSTAAASLLFLVPLAASIAFYVRNRGFVSDENLSNAALPPSEPPPPEPPETAVELPAPIAPTRRMLLLCLAAVAAAAIAFLIRPPSVDDAVDYRITKEEAKELARSHLKGALAEPVRFERVIATPVDGFRAWNPDSQREDGGGLGGFDSIAAGYLLRNGMSLPDLTGVFRGRIEAGTWSVRFFTPGQKEEVFVEIDPRTSRAIGFHRYLDEKKSGSSLTREEAGAIATRTLPLYGLDPSRFVIKDALTFQQPGRRDWLLHFEERVPLVPAAFRRVTVRIAGADVTQVAKHVHIPESVYHEASRQTLLNVVLLVLKIIGIIALLALVISGLVIATRAGGLPWRRPLRWAALLAIAPAVSFAAQYEGILFRYSTSVAWETFRVDLVTAFVRDVGLQAGMVFLALAGLEAAMPHVLFSLSREGRMRFGKSAALAALTAVALFALVGTVASLAQAAFPDRVPVSLSIPAEVAMPWPALPVALRALVGAVVLSAAAALYSGTVQKRVALVTITAIFFAALDPLATPAEAPLSIALALLSAIVTWIVARHILGRNPLAWPLAVFLGLTLQNAAALAANHRPDLAANAIALVVLAGAAVWWVAGSARWARS